MHANRPGHPAATGDRVDVVGFPIRSDYEATLEDATFRTAGSGVAPAPVAVTAKQAFEQESCRQGAGTARCELKIAADQRFLCTKSEATPNRSLS